MGGTIQETPKCPGRYPCPQPHISETGMDTPPMPDLEVPTHSAGGIQRSILETRGFSSSSSSAQTSFLSQEISSEEIPVLRDLDIPIQLDGGSIRSELLEDSIHNAQETLVGGPSTLESTPPSDSVQFNLAPDQPDIYIGTVKLKADSVDNIAGAFLQSTRKNLHFVPPSTQNGEIVIRPTREVVENGSKKCGFYFFRFRSRAAMEEIIEGVLGFSKEPIILQFWEQGMTLRQRKHSQIPVWIRLKHLPMEYWTDEGLSTVASGVGTPLYTDGITKECSRLDYARVCVMLDYNSTLPKHLIVISPVLRDGKEDPKRVDVEYEWLPQRCKQCCSLEHIASACPDNMKKKIAPPITIFVKKHLQSEVRSEVEAGVSTTNPTLASVPNTNATAPSRPGSERTEDGYLVSTKQG
ncbi:UNVERIFIED_CONTAM: hypothetical protein Sradi_6928900 [Sesamum radiatum]|uniref:DUF4283 domain-containing protein n=1 Tax=Sesamum radiatum TaxID=300843 RepID=A0AAW2JJ57_SESRA